MIGFYVVAALLLIGLVLLLLPSLLRPKVRAGAVTGNTVSLAVFRDQLREAERDLQADVITPERFAETKAEIELRLLEATQTGDAAVAAPQPARLTAALLLVLVPLASLATYWWLGSPQTLSAPVAKAPAPDERGHGVGAEQIQQMVAALADRLKANPDNAEGWMMLGRSYTQLGRFDDAAVAFKRANELAPGNASLLADYADVLGVQQGRRLAGQPAQLIQQALDADPRHVKALALAGTVSFQNNDFAGAIGFWERLLQVLDPASEMARSIRGSVAQAQARLTESTAAATASSTTSPRAAAADAGSTSVAGSVTISPALAAKVQPGDTVYVFARAAQGSRMPLAILRQPAGNWPLSFTLDDAMAMAPNLKLSGFASVVIGARVSRSGNATPQPGDLMGQSAAVKPGASGVRLVIDEVQR